MPKIALVISALLGLSLTPWTPSSIAKSDEPAAKKSEKAATKPSGKELLKQWADLLARFEKVKRAASQIEDAVNAAKSFEDKQKVQAAFEKLRIEYESEINPGLEQLAPRIHQLDPADPIATQIVVGKLLPNEKQETVPDENYTEIITMIKGLTRNDQESQATIENVLRILLLHWRQAQAAPLLDKLAAPKEANSRIVMLDGMAHFYLSEFDKAAELTARAFAAGADAPEAADFRQLCQDYLVFWKREQELRAAEAKADELPRVLFKTVKGEILIELFENEAPNTVANFISLVEAGKYDGVKFHRVIPGFMAQGGDPNTLDNDPSNDGQGGPGYTIPCECYTEKARMHFQGSLSMAHSGKDSGGSQFFITHAPTAHLNWVKGKREGAHTVFGRVIQGFNVALDLRKGDKIVSAKVVRKRGHAYVPLKVGDKPPGKVRK